MLTRMCVCVCVFYMHTMTGLRHKNLDECPVLKACFVPVFPAVNYLVSDLFSAF